MFPYAIFHYAFSLSERLSFNIHWAGVSFDFDKASKYVNAEIARGLIDSQFCIL